MMLFDSTKDAFDMTNVRRFHTALGHAPTFPSIMLAKDYLQLAVTEMKELIEALATYAAEPCDANLADVGKENADVMITLQGLAGALQLPMPPIVAEVARSNLAKLESCPDCLSGCGMCKDTGYIGTARPDGSLPKGPRYRKPDIVAVLKAHHRL